MRYSSPLFVFAACACTVCAPLSHGQDCLTTTDDGSSRFARTLSYPLDPISDIVQFFSTSTVAEVEDIFNNARTAENAQLGTSIPLLSMPSRAEWDALTDGEKALWPINREREDRGGAPLDGVESNVTSVAQYYADYLFANNAWGHVADGHTPEQRLDSNPAIGACHDPLGVSENLARFYTNDPLTSIVLPIEQI